MSEHPENPAEPPAGEPAASGPAAASAPQAEPAPELLPGREGAGPWRRWVLALTWPLAVLCAVWIVAGRGLFGAAGSLTLIYALTLGPALLAVLGLAAHWAGRDAARHATRATTPALAAVLPLTWALALIFGFLIPDRQDGRVVSGLSAAFGDDLVGLSAGFGNTFGILTFVGAFACLILAWTEQRRSRLRQQGGPATEDEWLDAQGVEQIHPVNPWR